MKRFILGAAVLSLFAADVAAAQTTVRENRRGDTVVTRERRDGSVVKRVHPDGSRGDRRAENRSARQFSYGGRRYNQVRGSRWVAPRGWSYRRYSIGASLPLFFLSASYYVDPFRYGLNVPRARYGQRWIRVHNDLYLVNRNGRVVQIIPNVFYY